MKTCTILLADLEQQEDKMFYERRCLENAGFDLDAYYTCEIDDQEKVFSQESA